ncbi:histidine--tRNA ligase [Candidatus Micrarchaeota archaeon]|nr:histidine--tRNA ligase [Candidatus Micrarchaeota archaeon]
MSAKLTPKGMRDIGPEDMFVREEAIEKIRAAFRLFGYRPLETPAMEYLETLRAKAGPEVDKQIFIIEGGEYGLRFDLTVPLARYAASTDAPKPFKRYAIDVVWRKEEPQRGRFREFYQADPDIVGSASMRCEAELLSLANTICVSFGFQKPRIMLNNRKILDGIAAKLGIEADVKGEVFRVLDKLDKIGEAEVEKLLREILGGKADELLKIIRSKGGNKSKLALAAKYSEEGAKELEEILALCGSEFEVEVDLFLVRGLGYYTGPVFEVKLSDDIGTVMAGGRYDSLLGIYGQPAPAVGISVGIERLVTLLAERRKGAGKKTDTKVLVACVKPDFYPDSVRTAAEFRKAGVACETDLNDRNIRKQLDYANSLGIPFVAVIGEREVKSKSVTLRDMASGKEEVLPIGAAIDRVKGG